MSMEDKVRAYRALGDKIEELEAQKKALVQEILQAMPSDQKVLRVAEYQVRRIMRLSIRTSLEDAKLLGAVKIEEVIDRDKIKELYRINQTPPGVSEFEYIQVSKKE